MCIHAGAVVANRCLLLQWASLQLVFHAAKHPTPAHHPELVNSLKGRVMNVTQENPCFSVAAVGFPCCQAPSLCMSPQGCQHIRGCIKNPAQGNNALALQQSIDRMLLSVPCPATSLRVVLKEPQAAQKTFNDRFLMPATSKIAPFKGTKQQQQLHNAQRHKSEHLHMCLASVAHILALPPRLASVAHTLPLPPRLGSMPPTCLQCFASLECLCCPQLPFNATSRLY